jgi:DNA-binding NarL/FixJ family response regulator
VVRRFAEAEQGWDGRAPGSGSQRGKFASLSGCHTAQRLLRGIAADPAVGPVALGIVGRGGTGKTALLDELARIYTGVGLRVRRCAPDSSLGGGLPTVDEPPTDGVLIVDDAQGLAGDALRALAGLAEQAGGPRLVVAHRPWPRPEGLAALDAMLTRDRPLVVLGHLDRAGVAERAAERMGAAPQPALLDVLHDWTGGLPAHVDCLAAALVDDGQASGGKLRGVPRMPAAVVEAVRVQLERLDPVARSLLVAASMDAPLDEALLSPLLDMDPLEVAQAVEAAQSAGLMSPDGTLTLVARHAVIRLTPLLERRALQERLAWLVVERGGSRLTAGTLLLGAGVTGARAAELLVAAGQEALAGSAELARSLFDQAIKSGARPEEIAARRAEAAAVAGDLDAALRIADRTVSDPQAPDRARGIRVAAAVLAHRGLLARSAQLHASLASLDLGGQATEAPSAHLLSVPGLVGTGCIAEAEHGLAAGAREAAGRLSLLADAIALTARGIYETVRGEANAGLSALVQASSLLESAGHSVLLPDTPAAFAAVVAQHSGDFDIADSVLERAVAAEVGEPLMAPRHRLLQSWTALLRGNSALARSLLDLAVPSDGRLAPRDGLFAVAIAAGIARRQSDLGALMDAWRVAREALMRHPVDLFVLQPLGELAAAAARLGELRWIQPFLDEGWGLLERLGRPPLWTLAMHWYGLQVAIIAEDLPGTHTHAEGLRSARMASGYAEALARAGHSWAQVLSREVAAEAVEAAARGLQDAGLAWDAARLAGQAAIRADEPQAMRALLTCARSMQVAVASQPEPSDGATLSERELQVASFVLAGLTYKEIGAQLFISSKTVEHHVARIRQRLGAGTRAELIAKLRALLTATAIAD